MTFLIDFVHPGIDDCMVWTFTRHLISDDIQAFGWSFLSDPLPRKHMLHLTEHDPRPASDPELTINLWLRYI